MRSKSVRHIQVCLTALYFCYGRKSSWFSCGRTILAMCEARYGKLGYEITSKVFPTASAISWNLPRPKKCPMGRPFDSFLLHKQRPSRWDGLCLWSRVRESNPPSRLGKPLYYRYTNPASLPYYTKAVCKNQPFFVIRQIDLTE